MESLNNLAYELDASETLIMRQGPGGQVHVLEQQTGKLLATITTSEGVLHIEGNAIASFVLYDCAPERSADIFLHAKMPPPPSIQILHGVISNPEPDGDPCRI